MRTQDIDALRIRTVGGLVNANGTIANGTGFVVVKTGTGAYTVYIRPRFRAFIDVEATLASGGFIYVTWSTPGQDGFGISTFSSSAVATDQPFLFSAKGIV